MSFDIFFPKISCGLFNVFDSFNKRSEALEEDFLRRGDGTATTEKVNDFIQAYIDELAAVQVVFSLFSAPVFIFDITGIVCAQPCSAKILFNEVSYTTAQVIQSHVSSLIFMFCFYGFLTNEVYQVRSSLEELRLKVSEQFPNPKDQFVINKRFYQDWCAFKENCLGYTYIFSYFITDFFTKTTEKLRVVSEIEDLSLVRGVRWLTSFSDTPEKQAFSEIMRTFFKKF